MIKLFGKLYNFFYQDVSNNNSCVLNITDHINNDVPNNDVTNNDVPNNDVPNNDVPNNDAPNNDAQ